MPRIANINKLDIPAASVKKTLASIEKRLTVQPLWSLRLCWVGREGKGFCGLLDLVIMQAFKWRLKDGNWGKSFTIVSGVFW